MLKPTLPENETRHLAGNIWTRAETQKHRIVRTNDLSALCTVYTLYKVIHVEACAIRISRAACTDVSTNFSISRLMRCLQILIKTPATSPSWYSYHLLVHTWYQVRRHLIRYQGMYFLARCVLNQPDLPSPTASEVA